MVFITVIHGEEPRKVLIFESRRAVLSRSAVHILPVFVSLVLIVINLRGYFIGRELQGTSGGDDLKMGIYRLRPRCKYVISNDHISPAWIIRTEMVRNY
jgi:hypothetical protein